MGDQHDMELRASASAAVFREILKSLRVILSACPDVVLYVLAEFVIDNINAAVMPALQALDDA